MSHDTTIESMIGTLLYTVDECAQGQVPIGKCFYGRDGGDLPAGGGEGNRIHHISDVMVRDARDKVGGG